MKKTMLILAAFSLFLSSILFGASATDFAKYGTAFYKKADYKKSLAYFTQAAKLDRQNPSYYAAIAACYTKLGNKAAANKFSNYAKSLSKGSVNTGAAAAAASEKIKITAFAGFTTASMGEVNNRIDESYATLTSTGATGNKQNIGSGFLAGAQAGYSPVSGLYVGPRFEYIALFPAVSTFSATIMGFTASGSSGYGGSLVDLMLGASYYFPLSGVPLNLSGDVYLGYGMAGLNADTTTTILGSTTTILAAYSGSAFAAVLCAGADYKLSKSFSTGLSLGYRLANLSIVTADNDVIVGTNTVIRKGAALVDAHGNTMPVDFSGLIVSLKANYAF